MIALACDHGGFELMRRVREFLVEGGYECKDFGTFSAERCDYPEIAIPAARAVSAGECDRGIFICSTGIGISIVANKTPGVRAALCTDSYMAEMTRRHNNANVLALGAHITGAELAFRIIEVFLSTGFEGGRHALRVGMIDAMDKQPGAVGD
jgi:ribose 5-phosphate isomerase B